MIISTTSDGRWQGDLRAVRRLENKPSSRRLALALALHQTVPARGWRGLDLWYKRQRSEPSMSLIARDIPGGEDIGPIERPTSLAVADIVFVVGARQGVRQRASRHAGGSHHPDTRKVVMAIGNCHRLQPTPEIGTRLQFGF